MRWTDAKPPVARAAPGPGLLGHAGLREHDPRTRVRTEVEGGCGPEGKGAGCGEEAKAGDKLYRLHVKVHGRWVHQFDIEAESHDVAFGRAMVRLGPAGHVPPMRIEQLDDRASLRPRRDRHLG
jgi:hypothetical protein